MLSHNGYRTIQWQHLFDLDKGGRVKARIAFLVITIVIVAVAVGMVACAPKSPSSNSSSGVALTGEELLNQRCSVCHSTSQVTRRRETAQQWDDIVSQMIRRGAELNDSEKKILVDYLAKTYAP